MSAKQCKHKLFVSFRSPKGIYWYECKKCGFTTSALNDRFEDAQKVYENYGKGVNNARI